MNFEYFYFYLGLIPEAPVAAQKYAFLFMSLVPLSGAKVSKGDAAKLVTNWIAYHRLKLGPYFKNEQVPKLGQFLKKDQWNEGKMNWKKDKPNWTPQQYFKDAESYMYYRDYPQKNSK